MHDKANTFLLFVYGTLKRGGCRHGPLAAQRFRGVARTRPRYALYDLGGYPGLREDAVAGQTVQGELYEVDEALLPWLDTVEGAPGWFARGPVEIEGRSESVWAYFCQLDPTGRTRILSGEWDNARDEQDAP